MPRPHYFYYAHHLGRLLLVETEQKEVPPALATGGNNNRPRGSHTSSEANFDTNMVIILAALLCVLICALGLNSILRCALLRCGLLRRRMAFETMTTTMNGTTSARTTGLKKPALQRIPVVVIHGSGVDHILRGSSTECPICLGEFMDGDKVRVLPKCNHGFHVTCIDTWLVSHSSCPICRHSLLEQQQQQQQQQWSAAPSDASAPDTESQGN